MQLEFKESKRYLPVFNLKPFTEVSTSRDTKDLLIDIKSLFAFPLLCSLLGIQNCNLAWLHYICSTFVCFSQQQLGIKQHFHCKALKTIPYYPRGRTISTPEITEIPQKPIRADTKWIQADSHQSSSSFT